MSCATLNSSSARRIPYGRQSVSDDDVAAVSDTLRSDWLTGGPKVAEFEREFAAYVRAPYAVAVSSGTAALHAAMSALGIGPGDEVIVPAITFVATANAVVFTGASPVICDVEQETLQIDPARAIALITPRTKGIIAVDYAGQPCDYGALKSLAGRFGIPLISDACHALGASWCGSPVGSLAFLNTFSFHPVKHITSGEGGMITTADEQAAARMRRFRNHGLSADHREREASHTHRYEMLTLGFNYRLSDFQCALALSQLRRLAEWLERRHQLASFYSEVFQNSQVVRPLALRENARHAWHLYVVRLRLEMLAADRDAIVNELRLAGIGANVHYLPVHLHKFYRERFGTGYGMCPVAESAYREIVSLPMYPGMTDSDAAYVADCVLAITRRS